MDGHECLLLAAVANYRQLAGKNNPSLGEKPRLARALRPSGSQQLIHCHEI